MFWMMWYCSSPSNKQQGTKREEMMSKRIHYKKWKKYVHTIGMKAHMINLFVKKSPVLEKKYSNEREKEIERYSCELLSQTFHCSKRYETCRRKTSLSISRLSELWPSDELVGATSVEDIFEKASMGELLPSDQTPKLQCEICILRSICHRNILV